MAPSCAGASVYPIWVTTKQPNAQVSGYGGGTLLTRKGGYPVRVITRVSAPSQRFIWRKGQDQITFMPHEIHITHIIFYAVGPMFIHEHHLWYATEEVEISPQVAIKMVSLTQSVMQHSL